MSKNIQSPGIPLNADQLAFKDRVWRLRTTLIYDGYDEPAMSHTLKVSTDVADFLGMHGIGVAGFDGLVTIHRLFGMDVEEDPLLPANTVQPVRKNDEEVD